MLRSWTRVEGLQKRLWTEKPNCTNPAEINLVTWSYKEQKNGKDKRSLDPLDVLNLPGRVLAQPLPNLRKAVFFRGSSSETFHKALTFNIDTRVCDCAHQLQDKVLIAKLSAVGDMISQEAVYHAKCLVELYNKAERSKQTTINENEKRI